ncbi:hypothetical protein Asch03_01757 [Acinetobacter schindleri]
MVIEFTQEHLDAFLDDREETLALWNWNRLKQLYSDLAEKNFDNDEGLCCTKLFLRASSAI